MDLSVFQSIFKYKEGVGIPTSWACRAISSQVGDILYSTKDPPSPTELALSTSIAAATHCPRGTAARMIVGAMLGVACGEDTDAYARGWDLGRRSTLSAVRGLGKASVTAQ